MSTESINRKTRNYAVKLKKLHHYPAVVVGAEHSRHKSVASSGLLESNKMVKKLRHKLKTIGNLYERKNGNTLGCCAETNAGNKILIKKPYLSLNEIKFATPLRPRTMQIISTCKNCKLTFN